MPTPGVGQDIEAMCGRCGQVWHVVMAKMGDRIAKVVCKRCGGHHGYRTEKPDGAEAPAPAASRDGQRSGEGAAAGPTERPEKRRGGKGRRRRRKAVTASGRGRGATSGARPKRRS